MPVNCQSCTEPLFGSRATHLVRTMNMLAKRSATR
jgi:hypothetical protein